MEYRTGDIVLVKAKVCGVDFDDKLYTQPYKVEFKDEYSLWVTAEEVVALVEREGEQEEETVEETKVELKYKVDDLVFHKYMKKEWGMGKITDIDPVRELVDYDCSGNTGSITSTPYLVQFPFMPDRYNAGTDEWWTSEENIILFNTEENQNDQG
jgi:hypothetical protein